MRPIILAALLPLAACGSSAESSPSAPAIPASGAGSMRSFAVADFTGVDLRGPDDVDVRVGAGFSVRAEGDAKILDKLRIEKSGSTLRIGRERIRGMSWGSGKGAKIFVTMPRITDASVAGSGDMAIDRIEGAKFEGGVAGSGVMAIAALAVQAADFSIAGSGDVRAGGSAGALTASVAGSGNIDAGGLNATSADVSIAGSGGVRALVDGAAKVSVMGSGDVDLGPKARCETSKMGSGSVRCGN